MNFRASNWVTRLLAGAGVIAIGGYFARDAAFIEHARTLTQHLFSGNETVLVRHVSSNGAIAGHIPPHASHLFTTGTKGPRADRFFDAAPEGAPNRRPMIVAASMTPLNFGDMRPADAPAVNRSLKGSRDVNQPAIPAALSQPTVADNQSVTTNDRATAALFFVSALASDGMVSAQPSAEQTDTDTQTSERLQQSGADGSEWRSMLQNARMSSEDATIFGGFSETEFRNKELHCMATAIYFESRGEPARGQMAVGQVIMNRVRSPFYPKTICGVVYQGSFNRTGCQFSFTCDGVADRATSKEQWANSMTVAQQVIARKVWVDEVGSATHYHATYVNPKWKTLVKRVAQIGVHIFYKAPFADPQLAYANVRPS